MIKRHSRWGLALARRIIQLERHLIHMATRIEQLISVVQAELTLDDSVLTLLSGFADVLAELRADVAAQGFDPKTVDKAIADLTTKQAAVLAAVKSGTELLAPAPVDGAPRALVVDDTPPGEFPSFATYVGRGYNGANYESAKERFYADKATAQSSSAPPAEPAAVVPPAVAPTEPPAPPAAEPAAAPPPTPEPTVAPPMEAAPPVPEMTLAPEQEVSAPPAEPEAPAPPAEPSN
jgi:hypothetical protein